MSSTQAHAREDAADGDADFIRAAARDAFGYDELRPGQLEAVQAVLAGRDTLAVMSTGSGKSAIYELADLLGVGATLVISPLISLQHDQIEAIEEAGAARAAALDGSTSATARAERLDDLAAGELNVLFMAPEQLARSETVAALGEADVSLVVVDEAHCISEWGHDFRPDYLRLGALVEELGHPTVLALTATAAPPVREEIVTRLNMREPEVVVRGFDRPNLWLEVESHEHAAAKREALIRRLGDLDAPGIIYVATRKEAEALAGELSGAGIDAGAYHAGLSKRRRDETQDRFMADELAVIVATTAFGMGVDKPNVRFVLHLEPSDSLDSYYQEIGRAGRDGEPATAVLFYRSADIGARRFYAAGGVDLETIAEVADALSRRRARLGAEQLKAELGLSQSKITTALSRLEDVGAIEIASDGQVDPRGLTPSRVQEIAAGAADLELSRQSFDRSRLEMMRAYAEHRGCRRAMVLSYFGEPTVDRCGNCDNCRDAGDDGGHGAAETDPAVDFLAPGREVRHADWGIGTVQRSEEGKLTVLFETEGYRTLELTTVLERDLLEPA